MTSSTKSYVEDVASALLIPTLRLVCLAGSIRLDGHAYPLAAGTTILGREVSPPEGIGLPEDRHVSAVHACIHVEHEQDPRNDSLRVESGRAPAARVFITDEQSKNGLYVNGKRVKKQVLLDGDVLRLGDSFFVLRQEPLVPNDADPGLLLGISPAIRALRYELSCSAGSAAPVLLLGESGTGKELAARTLHAHRRASGRTGPFVALNCAAIPANLAESHLFGHVVGAFSDARSASDGFFRSAHRGTLFLDELGELSFDIQAKLLRAIEEMAVIPVGSTRPIACDVRVVCATNRDLLRGTEVKEGRFRGDLYARLSPLPIELPPLRDRREDILLLLSHTWGPGLPKISASVVDILLRHSWPYNVRELVQLVEYLHVHGRNAAAIDPRLIEKRLRLNAQQMPLPQPSPGPALKSSGSPPVSSPIPSAVSSPLPRPRPEPDARQAMARAGTAAPLPPPITAPPIAKESLVQLLDEHDGNISKVADSVGRSRRQVYRWLKQYGIARGELADDEKAVAPG